MDIRITTTSIDVSVGLKAFQAYQARDYKKAIEFLLEILDMEPNNWQARLYLAISYARTNQLFAAQRAFRFLYDNCTDQELKTKAVTGMQQVNAQISGEAPAPEEFGRYKKVPGAWNASDR